MKWSADALNEGSGILEEHGAALFEQAERTARMARADTVSPDYVKAAAVSLRLDRPDGPWPEIVLGAGWTFIGAAGGVVATGATGGTVAGWLFWTTIAVGVAGFVAVTFGITSKVLAARV